jgi:hypothetical protein
MLYLFSAAAGARIVSFRFGQSILNVICDENIHNFPGRPALLQQVGHYSHRPVNVMKKIFQPRAQIIQSCFAIRRFDESVFQALAMTCKENVACSAVCR